MFLDALDCLLARQTGKSWDYRLLVSTICRIKVMNNTGINHFFVWSDWCFWSTELFQLSESLSLTKLDAVGPGQFTESAEVAKYNHLEMFCCNSAYKSSSLLEILKLPWGNSENQNSADLSRDETLKIKIVGLASKLVSGSKGESYHEIAEYALRDDNSYVQANAVLAIPAFSQHSCSSKLQHYCVGLL